MATTTVNIPWFTGTPALVADKETVDAAGDAAARTVIVTGTGFPPGYTGRVRLVDPLGADVTAVDLTVGEDGVVAATPFQVADTAILGDYLIISAFVNLPVPQIPVTVSSSKAPVLITDTADVMAGEKIDVTGSGWPVQKTVRVGLFNGTTEVIGIDAPTGDTGTFAGLFVQVPVGTGVGAYKLRASVGELVSNEIDIHVEDRHSLILPSRTDLNSAVLTDAERTIKVTGALFPASTTGTVSLLTGSPGTSGTTVASVDVTTDAEGAMPEVAVVVPKATPPGEHHLVAVIGTETSDDTTVAIRHPQILLSPKTLRKGMNVTINGADFHPWPTLIVWITGSNSGNYTYTDPDGTTHTRQKTIVSSAAEQEIWFSINTSFSSTVARQAFTVVPPMKLIPDATTVPAGKTLNVSGEGFEVGSTGTVGLYDGETVIVEADVNTTGQGQFPATALSVPVTQEPGTAQLRATINGETAPLISILIAPREPTIEWVPQLGDVFGVTVTARHRDQFRIDFGDGTTDIVVDGGQPTAHVYAAAGTYTVTATSSDATTTTTISVAES